MRNISVKSIILNLKYIEFGPVVQEEMAFKDISNLELWASGSPLFEGVQFW